MIYSSRCKAIVEDAKHSYDRNLMMLLYGESPYQRALVVIVVLRSAFLQQNHMDKGHMSHTYWHEVV